MDCLRTPSSWAPLPALTSRESGDEGKVEVTTTTEEMKPMGITAAGQQA